MNELLVDNYNVLILLTCMRVRVSPIMHIFLLKFPQSAHRVTGCILHVCICARSLHACMCFFCLHACTYVSFLQSFRVGAVTRTRMQVLSTRTCILVLVLAYYYLHSNIFVLVLVLAYYSHVKNSVLVLVLAFLKFSTRTCMRVRVLSRVSNVFFFAFCAFQIVCMIMYLADSCIIQ